MDTETSSLDFCGYKEICGFAMENYSSAINVSIFDGEVPVAAGEESLRTAPSLGFCSEASAGGWSLPSLPKRLQQLGGGFWRWGLSTIRLQPHLPHLPQHLGWMTSQLYPPHSTGTSIPEQHRSLLQLSCYSPTKPKLLPAAWEGKTGGAAGSREAAGPIWCSLTSRPNSGLSLSLGDGDGSPGDHHLLNTSSVLIVIPGWHCGT